MSTVPQLTTPEQFVLGACRCWDAFMLSADRALAPRVLAPAFAYMNALPALCAFDAAFHAIHRHRTRPLRFEDADCVRIGPDESQLLYGIASLQRGDTRAARHALESSLTRHGISAALPPLARIASVLEHGGHPLPLRRIAVSAQCRVTESREGGIAGIREKLRRAWLGDMETLCIIDSQTPEGI